MLNIREAFLLAKKEKPINFIWRDGLYMEFKNNHCFSGGDPVLWLFVDKKTKEIKDINTDAILAGSIFFPTECKYTENESNALRENIKNAVPISTISDLRDIL